MRDAAHRLEHHFKRQHHAIKKTHTLYMTSLFDESFALFHDHFHWTQKELDEQLKNFARITRAADALKIKYGTCCNETCECK